MRLIDADHLRKWIIANGNGWHFKTVEDILDQIDREDTYIVDAEPIRHGHWDVVWKNSFYYRDKCSVCGTEIDTVCLVKKYPYCPWCGAKMDAKGENDAD